MIVQVASAWWLFIAHFWHISVAELLHAKMLLIVVNGRFQVSNTVDSMEKTPLVLFGPLLDIFTCCHDSTGPGSAACSGGFQR